MSPDLDALAGKRVTAKRLGWDDAPDPAAELDREAYAEKGYDSPDLVGPLAVQRFGGADGSEVVACQVGGQEADPETVRPAE